MVVKLSADEVKPFSAISVPFYRAREAGPCRLRRPVNALALTNSLARSCPCAAARLRLK